LGSHQSRDRCQNPTMALKKRNDQPARREARLWDGLTGRVCNLGQPPMPRKRFCSPHVRRFVPTMPETRHKVQAAASALHNLAEVRARKPRPRAFMVGCGQSRRHFLPGIPTGFGAPSQESTTGADEFGRARLSQRAALGVRPHVRPAEDSEPYLRFPRGGLAIVVRPAAHLSQRQDRW